MSVYRCIFRRVCPGQHLADIVVWTAIATTLATSIVTKAADNRGAEITPSAQFSDGLVRSVPSSSPDFVLQHGSTRSLCSGVLPFPHHVRPRSDAALNLLRNMATEPELQ